MKNLNIKIFKNTIDSTILEEDMNLFMQWKHIKSVNVKIFSNWDSQMFWGIVEYLTEDEEKEIKIKELIDSIHEWSKSPI